MGRELLEDKDQFGFRIRIEKEVGQHIYWGKAAHKTDRSIYSKNIKEGSLSAVHEKLYAFTSNYTTKKCINDTSSHTDYNKRPEADRKKVLQELLYGLRGTTTTFGRGVLDALQAYQQQWGCRVYVRFGTTGSVASGKSGSTPRYQIESVAQEHVQTFLHSHKIDKQNEIYRNKNISIPFSIDQVKVIWALQ